MVTIGLETAKNQIAQVASSTFCLAAGCKLRFAKAGKWDARRDLIIRKIDRRSIGPVRIMPNIALCAANEGMVSN
jgi:hypothetical protein